ncbi:uncharacterized protein FIBRA_04329 [Fibroporia radiculosa]|uniref:G-protein coupled receptors family 1 profile domain-containing protein n=1 Tax=Fibroporia radiculosa TaxID=599839 RepID=J4G772_9APHY|nr:uncharacterized protein FIBRA_04329 [Fibroporia radiculosa]CCM02248.1 predicted protein [Fibroporia radiculosa]
MSGPPFNCSELQQLPNPFNELSYMPPGTAHAFQIAQYIMVGSMGALAWELLLNLPTDHRLLFEYRVTFPTIVYYFSRLSTLSYVLSSTIFQTYPTGYCVVIQRVVTISMAISVSSTSLLFYFRMAAVFHNNRLVMAVYVVLWLGVVAGGIMLVVSSTGGSMPLPEYCTMSNMENYGGAIGVMVLIHDTFVFTAISWRIVHHSYGDGENSKKRRMRIFLFGDYLQPISRTLLRDGQFYYVAKIGCNLVIVILFYIYSLSLVYRTFFTIPNVFVTNSMACLIVRHAKLSLGSSGKIHEVEEDKSIPLALPKHDGERHRAGSVSDCTAEPGVTSIRIVKTVNVEQVQDFKIGMGECCDKSI